MTLTFKIQIRGIKKPPVWRRIEIPAEFTFHDLHHAIQEAFGWWDYHLYMFEKNPFGNDWAVRIPGENDDEIGNEVIDARETLVFDFLMKTHLTKFVYVYDFGDSWVHDITLEDMDPKRTLSHPLCHDGKGATPHEDCGGIYGYEGMKKLFEEDPDSKDAREYKVWMGMEEDDVFDPNYLDLNEVNLNLSTVKTETKTSHKRTRREKKKDPKSIMLADTVGKLNKGDIIDFAEDLGLVIDTTLLAKPLKDEYAKAILANPRQLLCQLPMQDLMIIKKLKDGEFGPNIVDIHEDYFQPLLLVYGLAQEWRDGNDYYLHFGDDFRDAVTPLIDEVMDDMDVHLRVTIESLIEGMANLYGQVSHAVVKRELTRVHQGSSEEDADNVIVEVWKRSLLLKWMAYPENIDYYRPTDSTLYVSRYGWASPDDLKREIAKNDAVAKDYQPFTEMEIIMASRNPMPEIPNPLQEKFNVLLRERIGLTEWEALVVCHNLWYFCMHKGDEGFSYAKPADFFKDCVLEPLEVDDQLYSDAFLLLDDYLNQMPHWQLRGHAPAEAKAMLEAERKPAPQVNRTRNTIGYAPTSSWPTTPIVTLPKVGRNDPCPCGSGKKYKNCCGRGN